MSDVPGFESPPRLLVVPGLHGSGDDHWQTWLQQRYRGSRRVEQADWAVAELDAWAARVGETIEAAPRGTRWIAVAHSFGCLALARHLATRADSRIAAALLVAPADPAKFGVEALLPQHALPVPATLIGSETDPWMGAREARRWALRWACHWINLGDAGHINAEAGFGPLPVARRWTVAMAQRLERERRPQRATLQEWSFAI